MSLGRNYRATRQRIVDLLADLPDPAPDAPVPACPAWRVRDVVAHLTGVAEDGVAGRISGPPTEPQITEQVDRCRTLPLGTVLDRWERAAPEFERLIEANAIWAALIDIVSHEHDIRGAVNRSGARNTEAVRVASDLLLRFDPPVPLRIEVEDASVELGRGQDGWLALSTSRWEVLRWRTGRRSRAQLASMAWTGDPAPILDDLCVFGPAARDVIE